MKSSGSTKRPPITFGADALDFVREQLGEAATEFGEPLAARLLELEFGRPFSFVRADAASAASTWHHGGVDDGSADRSLAIATSNWLESADVGHERILLLEDPLACHTDSGVDPRKVHFGDHVYHAARAGGDTCKEVEDSMRELAGYPGIGVLTRPRIGSVPPYVLTAEALHALAEAAVAVLVRAWDDEAFLIVPVNGGPTLTEFRR